MERHILLIDDEVDILAVLSETLTLEGYRVSTARTAEAARRIIQSDPPHLVIADLQMEETDGLVLAAELTKTLPDVPTLLLTGVVFDHDVVRDVIQKQFSSYLAKMTPLSDILSEIRRLLAETGR